MITRFQAAGYGCLKKVAVDLTPLHAFIGPNDAGKTMLLTAIHAMGLAVEGKPEDWFDAGEVLFASQSSIKLAASDARGNRFRLHRGTSQGWTAEGWRAEVSAGAGPWQPGRPASTRVASELGIDRVRALRLDPEALRRPSTLIPCAQPDAFFRDRGRGMAGLLGAILGRGDESFAKIRSEVQRLFPAVRRVGVNALDHSLVELEAELSDGSRVRASHISEGLLCLLSFLVLPHIEGVTMLLVQQPERCLHPSRIPDLMRLFRDLVDRKGIQVLIETHSPAIVNELRPEEVSVVTRPSLEEGTRVSALKDTPMFEERSRVYRLGELWVRHADGAGETALLAPRPDEAP